MNHIAVVDIGKTNAKLALVESAGFTELAVITQPNYILHGGPWPHFDLEVIWSFIRNGLAHFQHQCDIDAISIATHGASVVLIGKDGKAFPMLDYEHYGPDEMDDSYARLRADFSVTGSPRLPGGLNIGAQLHWMLKTKPDIHGKLASIVTYPQYWGYLLTGELASDITSLGCHTDLWNPYENCFASTLDLLGLEKFFAPVRRPSDILGAVKPELARQLGLQRQVPVMVGIHDSNASLYPHLLGNQRSFSVVSSGTWTIAMAISDKKVMLDPTRDTLINVNALGHPVPTARFMGGREFDIIRGGRTFSPTDADRQNVLSKGIFLFPAVEPTTGPFQGSQKRWSIAATTSGQECVALSYYLALMTRTCLDLISASGPVIVEGPFAGNDDYLRMLSTLSSDGVMITDSDTGTSIGAALLCLGKNINLRISSKYKAQQDPRMLNYAEDWVSEVRKPLLNAR